CVCFQASSCEEREKEEDRRSLQEVKRRGRMERSREQQEEELSGKLKTLDLSSRAAASGTGLVYSEIFTHHQNLWDPCHPESPDRILSIMAELKKQELLGVCVLVEPREATDEELLLAHTKPYISMIESTQTMTQQELQMLSDKYDSVYLHPESFQVGVTAVGSVLQLVDQVMTSELRNGFAVIRPPGHHAESNEPNGYCVFNNVAIAARYAQTHHAVRRVLIVDWDVHHGQGLQHQFQEDPSVLYFSVHRYENGSFWPHLPESDCSFTGTGRAEGRTVNLAWNQTGMTDADYITAFQQVLLPVAFEFQPELVLVSAGFDAAVRDPKGEMCVSPQCFHILTHMLMSLAEGRLVLALEGGYNLQTTAESVVACIRALLGGACPHLDTPPAPSDSALESISQTVSALIPHWASLQQFYWLYSCSLRRSSLIRYNSSTLPALSSSSILLHQSSKSSESDLSTSTLPITSSSHKISKLLLSQSESGLHQNSTSTPPPVASQRPVMPQTTLAITPPRDTPTCGFNGCPANHQVPPSSSRGNPGLVLPLGTASAGSGPGGELVPVAIGRSEGSGLGFSVTAGGEGSQQAVVRRVWDCRRCPSLQAGDAIMKINGADVQNLNFTQVCLHHLTNDESASSGLGMYINSAGRAGRTGDHSDPLKRLMGIIADVHPISAAPSLMSHRFVTVRRGSPAARSGQIQPGDQLEAVDGRTVGSLQHRDLSQILRRAGNALKLSISPRQPSSSSSSSSSSSPSSSFSSPPSSSSSSSSSSSLSSSSSSSSSSSPSSFLPPPSSSSSSSSPSSFSSPPSSSSSSPSSSFLPPPSSSPSSSSSFSSSSSPPSSSSSSPSSSFLPPPSSSPSSSSSFSSSSISSSSFKSSSSSLSSSSLGLGIDSNSWFLTIPDSFKWPDPKPLHLQPSETSCNHQTPAATIRHLQQPSDTCSNHQTPAATIRHQRQQSETSSNPQTPAATLRHQQQPSETSSNHQTPAACHGLRLRLPHVSPYVSSCVPHVSPVLQPLQVIPPRSC
ncbi:transcript variant X2, partial [Nothobranchius furzeri]